MIYFTMTGPELKEAVARGEPMAQEEIDRRAAKKAAKRSTNGEQARESELSERTIGDALLTFKGFLDRMPIEDEARLKIFSDLYDAIENAVASEDDISGGFNSVPLAG